MNDPLPETVPARPSTADAPESTQVQRTPPAHAFQAPDLPLVPGHLVMRELARGGMGAVYLAYDRTFEREVAVKVMHDGQDAERFQIESKVTAQLQHPNIPPSTRSVGCPTGARSCR